LGRKRTLMPLEWEGAAKAMMPAKTKAKRDTGDIGKNPFPAAQVRWYRR
jgi:hypothetical protein